MSLQAGDRDIHARRFASNGTPQGGSFKVNTTIVDWQDNPTVAVDADGDFVISWESFVELGGIDYPKIQDGDSSRIYAQRYRKDGVKEGAEFKVNTKTTGTRLLPAAAMDADGDFVLVWADYDVGTNHFSHRVQRFRSSEAIDLSIIQSDSANVVRTGAKFSYTVNVFNLRPPATAIGNLDIALGIGAAQNLKFSFTAKPDAPFQVSGTDWKCVPSSGSGVLIVRASCVYQKALPASQIAPPVTITTTATSTPGIMLNDVRLIPSQIDPNDLNNSEVETTTVVLPSIP